MVSNCWCLCVFVCMYILFISNIGVVMVVVDLIDVALKMRISPMEMMKRIVAKLSCLEYAMLLFLL
jgi:hypothetical protein